MNTHTQIGWSDQGQPIFFHAQDGSLYVEHLQEGVLVLAETTIILTQLIPEAYGLIAQLIEEGRCSVSPPTLMEP